MGKKKGLWANIHAKRKRGEAPAKPGDEDYPTDKALKESALPIKEAAYERQNKKMRSDHKKDTGNTLGDRQTSGTGKRRVSFACRFAGMQASMKEKNGEPSKYAMALKKWGFSSREAARSFCNKNKES
jgi:hypothetical protein